MGQDIIYVVPFTDANMQAIVESINDGECPEVAASPQFQLINDQDFDTIHYDITPCYNVYFFLSRTEENILLHSGLRLKEYISGWEYTYDWLTSLVGRGNVRVEGDYFYRYQEVEFDIKSYLTDCNLRSN